MRRFAWQRVMVSAGISLMAVALTPFIFANTVFGQEDLQALAFGWPIPFVQQQSVLTPPADWFPQRLTMLNPWENPTDVLWGRFGLSVASVGIFLLLGFSLLSQFSCRVRRAGLIVALGFILLLAVSGYHILGIAGLWPGGGFWQARIEVPLMVSAVDHNGNGRPDALDIVQGARAEVERGTIYDSSYYPDYPPEGRGACTDVIWRALSWAGYDLKAMVNGDIHVHPGAYGETGENPDSNIDFRRVRNLQIFFLRHGQSLTTELLPGDVENLIQWQAGDIVVFGAPCEHIGVISDRRRADGVPFLIHNAGPRAAEADCLLRWPSPIIYHFRWP
ncbi:MAG: DUF1287 domain-containing protein [Bacillota bacterium]|jgi:uncharacterized protein YijF (DUF1287 family)